MNGDVAPERVELLTE